MIDPNKDSYLHCRLAVMKYKGVAMRPVQGFTDDSYYLYSKADVLWRQTEDGGDKAQSYATRRWQWFTFSIDHTLDYTLLNNR